MRILLIDPKGNLPGINIGLSYLISSLKLNPDNKIMVLDLNNNRSKNANVAIREIIKYIGPELIGISVHVATFQSAIAMINTLRNYYRNPVLLGGPYVNFKGKKILEENSNVDYLLKGECEKSIHDFLEYLKNGIAPEKVKGLIYRDARGGIVENDFEWIDDLDSLPFPNFKYLGVTGMKDYPLLTSRGCPYSCSFCLAPHLSGRRFRQRGVYSLVKELKDAIRNYGIKSFSIIDDNFTYNISRAEKFCEELIKERLNLTFECQNGIRADRVSENLVRVMKKAGCRRVFIGVESFVPEVFENAKKGESLEAIYKTVAALKKYHIAVNTLHIIGLPGDTYKKTWDSYRIARNIKVDRSAFQLLLPFPGTEVYGFVNTHGRWINKLEESQPMGVISFDTREFPRKLMLKAYIKLNLKNKYFVIIKTHRDSIFKKGLEFIRLAARYDFFNIIAHMARLSLLTLEYLAKGPHRTKLGVTIYGKAGAIDFAYPSYRRK